MYPKDANYPILPAATHLNQLTTSKAWFTFLPCYFSQAPGNANPPNTNTFPWHLPLDDKVLAHLICIHDS